MTARVLVVDDVDANVKLLEARLTAEYFEVRTARSGPEALHICARDGVATGSWRTRPSSSQSAGLRAFRESPEPNPWAERLGRGHVST